VENEQLGAVFVRNGAVAIIGRTELRSSSKYECGELTLSATEVGSLHSRQFRSRGRCCEAESSLPEIEQPLSILEQCSSDERPLGAYGKGRVIDAQF